MKNKVNYVYTRNKCYNSTSDTMRQKKLKKIKQNPGKWDCDSFQ